MRAAALTPEHGFEVVEVADPSPGPGELLLRVEACGICGSDLKAYDHMPVGAVLGHEFCGEVVGVGAGVEGWREGDRAAAMPLIACGTCRWCVVGEQAHCERIDYLGLGGATGGFAELVRAGASTASRVGAGLDGLGALVEPLAVGLHAVNAGGHHVGARVLVLGGGTVGAAVALWASRLGAAEIVVTDPSPDRRAFALTAGATAAVEPTGYDTGWDIVYECVGSVGMVATAVDAAATKGRVVIAGVCTAPDTFVPISAVMKEIDMRFAVFYRHDEFALAARLLSEGQLPIDGFVTRRVGLDGVGAAFADLKTGAGDRKILVVP